MDDTSPPANVSELLARVKATTTRIQAHRDAMAQVAAVTGKTTATDTKGGGAQ